jgi:hypothetical protein
MLSHFLQRALQEVKLTFEASREAILTVAERANRKIRILSLHWQASSLHSQIEKVYQDMGEQLCGVISRTRDHSPRDVQVAGPRPDVLFVEAIGRLQLLKRKLAQTDGLIRDLELEALSEDLVRVQYDLASRTALISRLIVEPGSAAEGCTLAQLGLLPTVRVAAVLRGPVLLADHIELRAGDIVLLCGLREEVQQSIGIFQGKEHVSTERS